MRKLYFKWLVLLLLLLILLIITSLFSLSRGEIDVSVFDLPKIFADKEGIEHTIVYKLRLPRVLLGFAVGGALSLAGVILQGIYRNPLVEPYTLGISGGAALGVALAIVSALHIKFGSIWLPLSGFLGALLATFIVYIFGINRGEIKIKNMLLIGVMISFIASSAMMFLLATTSSEMAHGIIFWTMGSLEEPDQGLIKMTLVISMAGLFITYLFARPLNALRLGQAKAKHLGVNTNAVIKILFIISSILTGISVSVAGVIGFVGLVVPHIVRSLIGNDFRALLLGSFLGGGTFLIFCDVLAHTLISPNELPVGVITGIIGGTAFIIVLSRTNFKRRVG